MHLCIIGTGAAGWMAANYFNYWNPITKISIVGSPEIMPIGVGESNTLSLVSFHNQMGISHTDFITQSDASLKAGVFYKNWSNQDFIHNFKGDEPWKTLKITPFNYFHSFANKNSEDSFNDYYAKDLLEVIQKNHIFLDNSETYPLSFHFDAGKYINFLQNNFNKNCKKNISYYSNTVVSCNFSEDEKLCSIVLNDKSILEADYYIFATGSSRFVEDTLKVKYEDLSDVLLTNKALVYPLKYTNKREQFHPYTVAKTMKYGWRWITPTWSRIGTGYVFSDKYVDPEKALQEFLCDVGNSDINPRLVDFCPRYAKKTFYKNYCLIGMCNGFLEPLDAPGLTLTIQSIKELAIIYHQYYYLNDSSSYDFYLEKANNEMSNNYKFWASFILTQYKTCHRNDTDFWLDHKNVYYDYYEEMIANLQSSMQNEILLKNGEMICHTMAAKGATWDVSYTRKPFIMPKLSYPTIHHEDFIKSFRGEGGLTTP